MSMPRTTLQNLGTAAMAALFLCLNVTQAEEFDQSTFRVLRSSTQVVGEISLLRDQYYTSDYDFSGSQGLWTDNIFTGELHWGILEYPDPTGGQLVACQDVAVSEYLDDASGLHLGVYSDSYANQINDFPEDDAHALSKSGAEVYFEVLEPVCYSAELLAGMGGNDGGGRRWVRKLEMVIRENDSQGGYTWVPIRTYFKDQHFAYNGATVWSATEGMRHDRMDHGRLNPGVYRITVEADTFSAPGGLAGEHDNWGNAAAYLELTPAPDADYDNDGLVDGQDLTTLLGIWGTSDSMHDLNCDGIIDGGDLNILLGAWTD
jgi:hypothetical protein